MASLPTISPEEYLLRDRANHYKSEYCSGHMYAMAGASYRHNLINSNVNASLLAAVRSRGCRPVSSDQRVYAPRDPFFAYPDTLVTCGPQEFLRSELKDTLTNPVLIVEVLSDSTREYDLGLKFAMYRTIPSLREYIAIEQNQVQVYQWRLAAGWGRQEYRNLTNSVALSLAEGSLAVSDIYLDVFEAEASS